MYLSQATALVSIAVPVQTDVPHEGVNLVSRPVTEIMRNGLKVPPVNLTETFTVFGKCSLTKTVISSCITGLL
jgi:hypothetical protein